MVCGYSLKTVNDVTLDLGFVSDVVWNNRVTGVLGYA